MSMREMPVLAAKAVGTILIAAVVIAAAWWLETKYEQWRARVHYEEFKRQAASDSSATNGVPRP